MRKQRGVAISLVLYVLAGLVAFGIGAGIVHKYNSAIEGKVLAEGKLKDCGDKYTAALGSIEKQNKGLEDLTKERDKAQVLAADALKLATEQAKRNEPERKRLAALERDFKSSGPCPAGDAVDEYRKGLKP